MVCGGWYQSFSLYSSASQTVEARRRCKFLNTVLGGESQKVDSFSVAFQPLFIGVVGGQGRSGPAQGPVQRFSLCSSALQAFSP
jgi:hypothetical protein